MIRMISLISNGVVFLKNTQEYPRGEEKQEARIKRQDDGGQLSEAEIRTMKIPKNTQGGDRITREESGVKK
jgi:hypothetical protein